MEKDETVETKEQRQDQTSNELYWILVDVEKFEPEEAAYAVHMWRNF